MVEKCDDGSSGSESTTNWMSSIDVRGGGETKNFAACVNNAMTGFERGAIGRSCPNSLGGSNGEAPALREAVVLVLVAALGKTAMAGLASGTITTGSLGVPPRPTTDGGGLTDGSGDGKSSHAASRQPSVAEE